MNTGGLIIIAGALLVSLAAYLWWASRPGKKSARALRSSAGKPEASINDIVKLTTSSIFDDEFREELRNRGRLHFEKIIGENAMFLQQDLRQTTTQLNDYMRAELTKTLQEEFKNTNSLFLTLNSWRLDQSKRLSRQLSSSASFCLPS